MTPPSPTDAALRDEILDLRERLREAEETIEAIRHGDVDALVVGGSDGPTIYTLENDDRPYRRLIEQIGEGALTLDGEGVVLYCNRALAELLQTAQEHIVGGRLHRFVLDADVARLQHLLQRGEGRGEFSLRAGADHCVPTVLSLSELGDGGTRALCAVVTDLTPQQRASAQLHEANRRLHAEIAGRENTETLLRQAQKMEAVGQLTGGLAHDFNNLLTGIIGAIELIQTRIAQNRTGELERLAAVAMASANRGAALTHRLLAFSRQQTLEPEPTDANRLVAGLEELIRRTAGATIAVSCAPAPDLWPTLCDPNQLENAILNLCINARDAMPDGGTLRIRTANARLDDNGRHDTLPPTPDSGAPSPVTAGFGDGVPGNYVMVAVADSGTGMTPEVAARAFDPFFTTKPSGQGTGLGLSMIYGFARQSGGHVRLESAQGRGTTLCLYLPRHCTPAAPPGDPVRTPS